MNIEKILREEIRARLDLLMGNPVQALEKLAPPKPQYAELQNEAARLVKGLKKTKTAQILDIPLGTAKYFATPSGVSQKVFVTRMRGMSSNLRKAHGCSLTVNKVDGGCMVTRVKVR